MGYAGGCALRWVILRCGSRAYGLCMLVISGCGRSACWLLCRCGLWWGILGCGKQVCIVSVCQEYGGDILLLWTNIGLW